jgi:hypothetical protein
MRLSKFSLKTNHASSAVKTLGVEKQGRSRGRHVRQADHLKAGANYSSHENRPG